MAKQKKQASANGHCLTADEIFAADDLPMEKVLIPEWGAGNYVFVRTQPGEERDAHELSMMNAKGGIGDLRNIRARTAVRCTCDADGKRVFSRAQADRLGTKSSAALDRIFEVYQRLNHMGDDDVKALAKNSNGVQSADSGTS